MQWKKITLELHWRDRYIKRPWWNLLNHFWEALDVWVSVPTNTYLSSIFQEVPWGSLNYCSCFLISLTLKSLHWVLDVTAAMTLFSRSLSRWRFCLRLASSWGSRALDIRAATSDVVHSDVWESDSLWVTALLLSAVDPSSDTRPLDEGPTSLTWLACSEKQNYFCLTFLF